MWLYAAAAIATVVGGGAAAAVVWWELKHYPWTAFLVMLPSSFVVNYLVKAPLFAALFVHLLGFENTSLATLPLTWGFARYMAVPLIEEAAKAAPCLLPWFRRRVVDARSRAVLGFVLGTGFGVSEAWTLAYMLTARGLGGIEGMQGFIGERTAVILGHAVMTMVAVQGMGRGFKVAVGYYLAAVGLHALCNSGAGLMSKGLIGMVAAGYLTVACTVATIFIGYFIVARQGVFASHRHDGKILFRTSSSEQDIRGERNE